MKKRIMLVAGLIAGMGIANAQQKTQVEFWTFYLSPTFDNFIKGMISDYEAKNPNITIKWSDHQMTIQQDLISAINIGSPPDVVNLNIDWTTDAAQNSFLLPLDKVTSLSKLKLQFWQNPLNNFVVNGHPYGFPWYASLNAGVLSYNSEILAKAGISKLPKTMDELNAMSQTIKDKTGAYGYVPTVKDPAGATFLGVFFDENLPITENGKAVFNTQAHADVLQKYVDMYRKGYIPEDAMRREAFTISMELYNQGKLAFIVGGPQALTRVRDTNKDLYAKTKITTAPVAKSGKQTGTGMDLVIPAMSKHAKEAARFAAFITNNANQMKFAKIVPIIPTSKGAESDPFFKTTSKDPIAMATAMVGKQGRFIDPGFRAPANSDEIYKHFNDDIEAAFLGKMTAKAALDDAVTFWNTNLKK